MGKKEQNKKQNSKRTKSQAKKNNARRRSRKRYITHSALIDRIKSGDEDLSTWTTDELLDGFPASRHKGRPPSLVPIEVFRELVRRVMDEARFRFVAELQYAMDVHFDIIKDEEAPYAVRLEAIKVVYDRVLGKQPDTLIDKSGGEPAPWQKMMADAIVNKVEDAAKPKRKAIEAKAVVKRG